LIFLVLLVCISCTKTYNIKRKDFKGVELLGRKHTYKMTLSLKAQSQCPAYVEIFTGFEPHYHFRFHGKIDTTVSSDWYGDPMKLKVIADTCLIKDPKIRVTFYN
jgi:hypothetical protein